MSIKIRSMEEVESRLLNSIYDGLIDKEACICLDAKGEQVAISEIELIGEVLTAEADYIGYVGFRSYGMPLVAISLEEIVESLKIVATLGSCNNIEFSR